MPTRARCDANRMPRSGKITYHPDLIQIHGEFDLAACQKWATSPTVPGPCGSEGERTDHDDRSRSGDYGALAAGAPATALRMPTAPSRREHDHPKQEGQALSQCPANCYGGKPARRQYSYEAEHENGVRPVHEDIRCDPVARDEH